MNRENQNQKNEAGHLALYLAGYNNKNTEELKASLPVFAMELRIKKLFQEL